jgi:hypothetical protein
MNVEHLAEKKHICKVLVKVFELKRKPGSSTRKGNNNNNNNK